MVNIEVEHITKHFGSQLAVSDVSFCVEAGEIFGLLGPNGAGKTTSIRIILDILEPDAGQVAILGGPMTEEKKSRIGYLPEDRGLYQDMQLERCLVYLATLKGLSEAEAHKQVGGYLERFDLAEHRRKKIKELSKGMQQKAQLIATLVHKPALIIIDEPFSGLDPINTQMIKDLLVEERSQGVTIVMSTHQMVQVEELCDRLVLINQGKVVLYGSLNEVRNRYASRAVLVRSQTALPEMISGASGREKLNGVTRITLEPGAAPQDVLRSLVSQNMIIEQFEIAVPTLDEIFIDVVQGGGSSRVKKFWLICNYEYLRHVRRKRFIFALLSMPLMVLLMIGAGFLAVWANYDSRPIGYVDLSGILANAQPVPNPSSSELFPDPQTLRYPDETAAKSALAKDQIQGFFTLQPSYMADGSVQYTTPGQPKDSTETAFRDFLRYNLVTNQPPEIANRLVKGPTIEVRALDNSRQVASNDVLSIVFPMVIGILFLLVINTSGSYLVGALVEEKENRMMEIVVTSVSTDQLMAGKVVGNLAVGLTELVIWVLFGLGALALLNSNLLNGTTLKLDSGYLLLSFLTLLPGFVMVAGLMATAGVTASDTREAQQIAGMFTLPIVIPFWLIVPLIQSPNSPLAVGLSLFPLTAPISLPLRAAFTNVPLWQTATSLGLLTIGAVGAIWLAARTFRIGMLRYGKRLSLREVFRKA